MDINKIDTTNLSLREQILINQKLPRPKQNVFGDIQAFPVTFRLGCRIELSDKPQWHDGNAPAILIDGKKVNWGPDSTLDFEKNPNEYLMCIGESSLHGKYPNHIDHLYSPYLWKTGVIQERIPLAKRQGWCCTMFRQDQHRDHISELLINKYQNQFTGSEWFCYDQGHNFKDLFKYMFRKPHRQSLQKLLGSGNMQLLKTFPVISGDADHKSLGPWHAQTMIELVPETTTRYFDPTEKIYKPISAGMPFVMVASQGFLYRLRKMGFRTFHPWIDESYDQEPDWKIRTEMAVAAMFEFVQSPHDLDHIQSVCDHNQQTFRRIRQHDYLARIAKKLRPLITFE